MQNPDAISPKTHHRIVTLHSIPASNHRLARVERWAERGTVDHRFTLDEVALELHGVRIWHLDTKPIRK